MASLDQDFKPSGRPTSMMAQRFSMILDSAFGLDEASETVLKKKEEVASQSAELEELEARLKAMEEQLQVNKPGKSAPPTSSHTRSQSVAQKPYLRGPIAGSVRPETPRSEQPKTAAPVQTKKESQSLSPSYSVKRILSFRRKQRRRQSDDEEEESEEEASDFDMHNGRESQSSTSSDVPRKA